MTDETPVVTEEAVEAADVAFWHDPGRESFTDALTAALPFLVADRDTRIRQLEEALRAIVATDGDHQEGADIARAALEEPP